MNIKRSIILTSSLSILVLFFQNCQLASPDMSFTQDVASKNAPEETDDNGHPYDGKIFVLNGSVCPDGTRIRARIVVKDESNADLVREECQEISPKSLGSNDFQINPANPRELTFQSQVFVNQLVGTPIEMKWVTHEGGNSFWMTYNFGTPSDDMNVPSQSRLQIYEDGKPMGPAHSLHQDIRILGQGRFSHWVNYLYFSATDNSDPRTNGRTYTWDIK